MPTVLIIGGSGKVATYLTKTLLSASSPSYKVHSLIRSPTQSPSITSLGAHPIVQDIETTPLSTLTETFESVNPDVIVFAAGAGGGDPARTKSVDHEGAIRVFDAAAAAGVKRLILVSALDVRDAKKGVPEWYNEADQAMSARVRRVIGVYLDAKLAADTDLVTKNEERGLEYTIVRPGGLTNEEGTGKIEAGKVHISSMISRADVAEVVKYCVEDPGTIGLAFDVVGGETPVAQAVKTVAEQKIDTFDGYY